MSVTLRNNYVFKIVEKENKRTRTGVPYTAGNAVCAPPTSAGPTSEPLTQGRSIQGTLGLGLSLLTPQRPKAKEPLMEALLLPSQGCRCKVWVLEGGRWPRAEQKWAAGCPTGGVDRVIHRPYETKTSRVWVSGWGRPRGGQAASSTGASLCPGTTQKQALRASTNHPPHPTPQDSRAGRAWVPTLSVRRGPASATRAA